MRSDYSPLLYTPPGSPVQTFDQQHKTMSILYEHSGLSDQKPSEHHQCQLARHPPLLIRRQVITAEVVDMTVTALMAHGFFSLVVDEVMAVDSLCNIS